MAFEGIAGQTDFRARRIIRGERKMENFSKIYPNLSVALINGSQQTNELQKKEIITGPCSAYHISFPWWRMKNRKSWDWIFSFLKRLFGVFSLVRQTHNLQYFSKVLCALQEMENWKIENLQVFVSISTLGCLRGGGLWAHVSIDISLAGGSSWFRLTLCYFRWASTDVEWSRFMQYCTVQKF